MDACSARYDRQSNAFFEWHIERGFNVELQEVKENDPDTKCLSGKGSYQMIQNMTDEEWEEIGRDISNNTHLEELEISEGALNDHKISFLFRGLTRSNSIETMVLTNNGFGVAGVRSMVPFLQNANNLTQLHLNNNDIQSEGFNLLFRALRDSPIETLSCDRCGIESIEIDNGHFPKHLEFLNLYDNSINVNGCHGLAKLLQGADSTLTGLNLAGNQIDDEGVAILIDALQNNTSLQELELSKNQIHDEGVAILVDALQSNTSLKELDISENEGISVEGAKLCLQLVNDISRIKATLQSNHTLQTLEVKEIQYDGDDDDDDDVHAQIQRQIDNALEINMNHENDPEAAGREKVICSQLHSEARAKLAELQGVDRSLYSEINPLHLPEVLALVGRHHGQGELYVALKSSIAGVISTVNRKECIQ
jgi:hypothetical protein